ncbi:MAG: GNAT family N-acetyltransferase [Gammaproteobacteria bacterium]|nr:GNAT family N-acetyltransferase [Gammaproteobacteria bacterium]
MTVTYQTTELPDFSLQAFASLTFPHYQRLLFLPTTGAHLAVVARSEVPVGLALCRVNPHGNEAVLLSLFIIQNERRRGIGSSLLEHLRTALAERSVRNLTVEYSTRREQAKVFEKFLARTGWSCPQDGTLFGLHRVAKCFEYERFGHPRWNLPARFEQISIAETTETDRNSIASAIREGQVPEKLDPFWGADERVDAASVLLRHEGQIVGWLICHSIPVMPAVLRYSRLYTEPRYRSMSLSTRLYLTRLHRHATSPLVGRYPRFLIDIPIAFAEHRNLVLRHFSHLLDEVYYYRSSERIITDP